MGSPPLRDGYEIPPLMEFCPLRGDCNIHPYASLMGFFQLKGDHENPLLMGFSHSEVVTTSIHPSTHLADGIFPIRRQKRDSSAAGISPTWRIVSVHSADGIFSTRKCQCRLVDELFSVVLGSQNPPLWDYPHPESPTMWRDFPHSELLSNVPLMGLPPLGAYTLAYGLPSSEPSSGWASCSFSLSGSFHILMMGLPPRRRQLHWWDIPHTRWQLRWWVYSNIGGIGSLPDKGLYPG